MNIFEQVTKQKVRFQSDKGLLTAEQLWNLPLRDLDKIARAANSELKSLTEDSFVDVAPDPRKTEYTLQLDVLKHIISKKLEEKAAKEQSVEREQKRRVLLEALSSKENEELNNMSKEDILKQLEEL